MRLKLNVAAILPQLSSSDRHQGKPGKQAIVDAEST
jgi:hypothetical protein